MVGLLLEHGLNEPFMVVYGLLTDKVTGKAAHAGKMAGDLTGEDADTAPTAATAVYD